MSEISHKKIKILFPALHYPPVIGGIERWTCEIAQRLSDKADVFVITGKVEGQPQEEIKNGVKIVRCGIFSLENLSASPLFYTLSLLPFIYFQSARLIKKEKINLLHCSGFLSGVIGYLLNKRFTTPFIITIQSLQANSLPKRFIYKRANLCIGASRAIIDYFKEIGVKNTALIPNGIDISRFSLINKQEASQKLRKELGFSENDFVIVCVARLDERKGIKYLIEAIHLLNYKLTTNNYKLLLIGDGEKRDSLEKLALKLKCEDKVRFVGGIPNNDLPQYLASCDCFCLPSLQEGFGIVVLEAMATNLPVVASKVGGILDLIENEKTGILVEPRNVEAIADALAKIKQNPNFAKQLTENAKVSLVKYDWNNIAENVWLFSENQCSKVSP